MPKRQRSEGLEFEASLGYTFVEAIDRSTWWDLHPIPGRSAVESLSLQPADTLKPMQEQLFLSQVHLEARKRYATCLA